jgi:hypothetical protein
VHIDDDLTALLLVSSELCHSALPPLSELRVTITTSRRRRQISIARVAMLASEERPCPLAQIFRDRSAEVGTDNTFSPAAQPRPLSRVQRSSACGRTEREE